MTNKLPHVTVPKNWTYKFDADDYKNRLPKQDTSNFSECECIEDFEWGSKYKFIKGNRYKCIDSHSYGEGWGFDIYIDEYLHMFFPLCDSDHNFIKFFKMINYKKTS